LPRDAVIPYDVCVARVTSQGLIQVGSNQYSVPAILARQQVSAHLYSSKIVIYHEHQEVARHPRCWGKHQLIQDQAHLVRPWSVHPTAGPAPGADGLPLPAKACVTVARPDLSRYDHLTREDSDE
jgi:hypothetical protein